MRVVGLLQARWGSSRLPAKCFRTINGLPLIVHLWRRLLACHEIDECVVAWGGELPRETTFSRHRIYVVSETEENLLRRLLWAGEVTRANAIVRVTGDCLFHDPWLIDSLVAQFRAGWPNSRGMANWPHRTHSEGVDCDIWSMDLLEELARTSDCPREDFAAWVCNDSDRAMKYHVTLGLQNPKNDGEPHLSIDTPKDLARAEKMLKLIGNNEYRYAETLAAYRVVESVGYQEGA